MAVIHPTEQRRKTFCGSETGNPSWPLPAQPCVGPSSICEGGHRSARAACLPARGRHQSMGTSQHQRASTPDAPNERHPPVPSSSASARCAGANPCPAAGSVHPPAWRALLLVHTGVEDADVRQRAVLLFVVHAVAHDKLVRADQAHVVRLDGHDPPGRLVQQHARPDGRRAAVAHQLLQTGHGLSRVADLVQQQHVLAVDGGVQVLLDFDVAAGHSASAVAADGHKLHFVGDFNVPDEVRHEHEHASHESYHHQVLPQVVFADLFAQFRDSVLDVLLCEKLSRHIVICPLLLLCCRRHLGSNVLLNLFQTGDNLTHHLCQLRACVLGRKLQPLLCQTHHHAATGSPQCKTRQ
mmetsp:Transcript_44635/g.72704  ORF Transcript_44635/g.72704 Transcript_44635/m.72704 type:complete len:353 (-) Transcript_44635:38-1096(-)